MPKISKEIHYLSNQMYEEYQTIDGVKEGRATFVFANGDFEEYTYVEGIKQGKATLFKRNGDKEEYFYLAGVKDGEAKLYLKEGLIKRYRYRAGYKDYSNYSEIENLSISQVCNSLEKSEEMERFYYLNDECSEESEKYGDSDEVEAVFFDTETNGVGINHSVLSISAVKVSINLEMNRIRVLDRYEKFYYPKERYFNREAVKVHGLDRDVITQRRGEKNYPKYFVDDEETFFKFCGNCQHFVAHNISFDKKYLHRKLPKEFCTMRANSKIINLKNIRGACKPPKLVEATEFYQIYSDESKFHDSMYDVEMTIKVFKAMLTYNTTTRLLVEEFLLGE